MQIARFCNVEFQLVILGKCLSKNKFLTLGRADSDLDVKIQTRKRKDRHAMLF